jgi:hypothetical protein
MMQRIASALVGKRISSNSCFSYVDHLYPSGLDEGSPIDSRAKEEILQAIATLAQSGIRISVEQIHGREDLLTQLVELTTEFRAATDHLKRLNGSVARHEEDLGTLKLRAASRDAMCPLIEVLRAEVKGIQTAILKDLQEARDMVVERKAEVDME